MRPNERTAERLANHPRRPGPLPSDVRYRIELSTGCKSRSPGLCRVHWLVRPAPGVRHRCGMRVRAQPRAMAVQPRAALRRGRRLATTIAPGMAVSVRRPIRLAIAEAVEAVRFVAKWHELATTIAPGIACGVFRRLELATAEEVEAALFLAKWHDLATTIAPGIAGGARRRSRFTTVEEHVAMRFLAKWHDLATTIAFGIAYDVQRVPDVAWLRNVECASHELPFAEYTDRSIARRSARPNGLPITREGRCDRGPTGDRAPSSRPSAAGEARPSSGALACSVGGRFDAQVVGRVAASARWSPRTLAALGDRSRARPACSEPELSQAQRLTAAEQSGRGVRSAQIGHCHSHEPASTAMQPQ